VDQLQKLLDFTSVLEGHNIPFKIERTAPDELMVTFATVSRRIEVYFSPKQKMGYSVFEGPEDVLDNESKLMEIIDEFVRVN
jgi:hypothetical protein